MAQEHWDPTAALTFQKEQTEELPAHPGGHPKLADISEMQITIFYFIPHLWRNFLPGRGAARINSLTSVKHRYYFTKCTSKSS